MGPLERKYFARIRVDLLKEARGNVLEIGSGTGLNFGYYTHAEKVTALEPNPKMTRKASQRATHATVPIEVIFGNAETLPFEDNTFDTIVGTLVLCTIPDPEKALSEIRRVCKNDGIVLFFEHIRLNNRYLGKLQDFLTPVWRHLCDGCHLNRNSSDLIKQIGFKVVGETRYFRNICVTVIAINKK
nr:class I SAM-dependent methyltransferase [Paenibacillus anseongense]